MNQLGSMGTTYTSEGPARMAGGGRCKGTGEAGQNLVAPGLRSVTNKPSKSVFSFIASRKALPINAPQSPNSGRISPTPRHSHAVCHISRPLHTLSLLLESLPLIHWQDPWPLSLRTALKGRFLEYLVCCRALGT